MSGKPTDFNHLTGYPPICRAINLLFQIPQGLKNVLKVLEVRRSRIEARLPPVKLKSDAAPPFDLEKQLCCWKKNPQWIDEHPEIVVTIPRASLCNIMVRFKVGLPPEAVYNIIVDPDNRRVFRNIKEVISRRVLLDEGLRQVVELEQSARWRFLCFSGTVKVHVLVEQNRAENSVRFKQGNAGFMKRFEGYWRIEPLFVDKDLCCPIKPTTSDDYAFCTNGGGRIGSVVCLEQLVEPALLPPPPILWYLRGITTRTIETLVMDLLAETDKIRKNSTTLHAVSLNEEHNEPPDLFVHFMENSLKGIKERWSDRRKGKRSTHRLIITENMPASFI